MYRYHRESDLSYDQVEAGLANGHIEPWNVDTNGEQWYRSLAPMHGVPSSATETINAEDGDDD